MSDGGSSDALKPPGRNFGLSKSRLTDFEQCARKLWLSVHRRELAVRDDANQYVMDRGHEIGAVACSLWPDGVMIEADPDLAAAVERTAALMASADRRPLFEATFVHHGVLVRVDILAPEDDGAWRMYEVKSTASVKAYHLADLATQAWVLGGAGVTLSSASIQHIDTGFVLKRAGDYDGLFKSRDLTLEIRPLVAGRDGVVQTAREVLAGAEPSILPGAQCHQPFDCEFQTWCGKALDVGPEWPISLIPRIGSRLAQKWAQDGILDLRDVPDGGMIGIAERIRQVTRTGETYRDQDGARRAVADWAYPRAYLDFETIGFAAPRWVGTRPFQNLPFQFSCHFEAANGELTHTGFLAVDGDDPRRRLADRLVDALGRGHRGAIVTYNAAFERSVVRELAAVFPDLAERLMEIVGRIVDLLPVTREHYYHRDQRGSWSIKAVLPTIAPHLSYDDLEVGDGQMAQYAWLEAVNPMTDSRRRQAIGDALEAYCTRDTEAMVVLLRSLTSA